MWHMPRTTMFQPKRTDVAVPLPTRPWEMVATDLFQWEQINYMVVEDYYSRYVEIARLEATRSQTIVTSRDPPRSSIFSSRIQAICTTVELRASNLEFILSQGERFNGKSCADCNTIADQSKGKQ